MSEPISIALAAVVVLLTLLLIAVVWLSGELRASRREFSKLEEVRRALASDLAADFRVTTHRIISELSEIERALLRIEEALRERRGSSDDAKSSRRLL